MAPPTFDEPPRHTPITGPEVGRLADAWAAKIAADEPDPIAWLPAVRRGVEALGLDPTRCIPLPANLKTIAWAVIDEARKQSFTALRVAGVLRLPG